MGLARLAMIVGLGAVGAGVAALFEIPGVDRSAVFLFVFLGEMIAAAAWASIGAVGRPGVVSYDARPADGLVPIVGIAGLGGAPNEARPEILVRRRPEPVPIREASKSPRDGSGPLLGRIGIFSIFIGRDGSTWSDREVAEAYRGLERMGRWIEREAVRYDVPANLEILSPCFVADDSEVESVELATSHDAFRTVLDESDADLKGIASASRASRRLGFSDLADLVGRVDPLSDHDQTVWIVHQLRAGRSSAIGPERFRYPGARVALCYARESSNSEPLAGLPFVDPATLAHEILHLFGATDKYGTSLRSFPPGTVTSRDAMRLDEIRLSRLRIDPLTAAEIGWPPGVGHPEQKGPASPVG